MTKPTAIRRITAPVSERLNRLAAILYDFLPLSSRHRATVTFRTIFAQSRVEGYLDGKGTKKQLLTKGFVELYRRHERLPRAIVRKIVPAAVEYRRYRRDPLQRAEVDALSECLLSLDIDMRAELSEVQLDEMLPRITVPPKDLKDRLRNHDLDPTITGEPLALFENGHFNESVRKAAEVFEDRVRTVSGLTAFGRDLMAKAFAGTENLALDSLRPDNRAAFNQGFKFMAMGLMASIRNVFSHGDEERRAPEECFEMLMLVNWMLRALASTEPDES